MKTVNYKCDFCKKKYDLWQLREFDFKRKHICKKCNEKEKLF